MSKLADVRRHLVGETPAHLKRPLARLQPLQAREGRPTVDVKRLALKSVCEEAKAIGEGVNCFGDLPGFVESISREHTAVVYGDHVQDMTVLGETLGLTVKVF